jgi:hypothetical protein
MLRVFHFLLPSSGAVSVVQPERTRPCHSNIPQNTKRIKYVTTDSEGKLSRQVKIYT